LLQTAGIGRNDVTGADNDESLIYCTSGDGAPTDAAEAVLDGSHGDDLVPIVSSTTKKKKCIIFAQFTQSLDALIQCVFEPLFPALRYLRLDGTVTQDKRHDVVDLFQKDDSIQVLLLTTRVGGLGLNLTGASIVIFLEHDFNPHADLQAMDRAHRLGQSETVHVYRLITKDSVEEHVMRVQQQKMDMSDAIVNSDNSTMFRMLGTG